MGEAEARWIAGRRVRWNAGRAAQAYAEGWWSRDTLGDALIRAADVAPDRVVIVDGAIRLTCGELSRRALALARAMLVHCRPGDVVTMMLPNWHEAAIVYHAATLAGLVVQPVLPAMRERELGFLLADSESRMVFAPGEFRGRPVAEMVAAVAVTLDSPPSIVAVRRNSSGQMTLDGLVGSCSDAALPPVDPDAVRMMMYTSGTTGRPKGVLHSQNSIRALIRQLGDHWSIDAGDRFLVPSPVSHIGGSIYAFEVPVMLGTAAVLMEQWDADAALALMRSEGVTHMAGATPFLEQLVDACVRADETLPTLKVFICGGAGVPPALIERSAAQFANAVVTRVYGSTEVPVITVGTLARADLVHAAQTDGLPGMAQVKLSPSDVPGGEEICAQGPQMLVGYHRAEDEADAFDGDGFFRTGDLGHFVDGRYLVISGRAKDIIIRNGENIAPKEVEDLLAAHPGVADVAIVGLPDPRTGERACAVIVPRDRCEALTLTMLTAFLRESGIASFKLPEQLVLWPALPKNATGKILKYEIRSALLARAGEEA